jgi:hypothetical protein
MTPSASKNSFFLSHNVGRMVSPIVVAVVAEDGRGSSAKIEIIEAARETMQ